MLLGIDLASHQGGDYDFARARREGREFAIIKASGGHDYRNPHLAAQVAAARDAGMAIGFYHYQFEPSSGGGDVYKEAANFVAATKPYAQPGTTFWLDVEEYPGSVGFAGDLEDWLMTFVHLVNAEYGCSCGIYSGTYFMKACGLQNSQRLKSVPFWMASWQEIQPALHFARPFDNITIWQNDAYSLVAGRQTDTDIFNGTRQQFEALGVPFETQALREILQPLQPARADGAMSPVRVTLEHPTEPGFGIPYKAGVWAWNPDEQRHYYLEWELGAYKPWVALD